MYVIIRGTTQHDHAETINNLCEGFPRVDYISVGHSFVAFVEYAKSHTDRATDCFFKLQGTPYKGTLVFQTHEAFAQFGVYVREIAQGFIVSGTLNPDDTPRTPVLDSYEAERAGQQ